LRLSNLPRTSAHVFSLGLRWPDRFAMASRWAWGEVAHFATSSPARSMNGVDQPMGSDHF